MTVEGGGNGSVHTSASQCFLMRSRPAPGMIRETKTLGLSAMIGSPLEFQNLPSLYPDPCRETIMNLQSLVFRIGSRDTPIARGVSQRIKYFQCLYRFIGGSRYRLVFEHGLTETVDHMNDLIMTFNNDLLRRLAFAVNMKRCSGGRQPHLWNND